MEVLDSLLYTEDHEWLRIENNKVYIGITDFAQQQLGDVVFIQLPEVGMECKIGSEVAVIESVKAASEIYAPVSGIVKEVNENLNNAPDIINSDAESDGWIWKMSIQELSELDSLMDEATYSKHTNEIS